LVSNQRVKLWRVAALYTHLAAQPLADEDKGRSIPTRWPKVQRPVLSSRKTFVR
jgi:hypothetical protein